MSMARLMNVFEQFLYKKYNLRENYCRNPTWDKKKNPGKRPWCYTDDIGAETHWEYCDIPACKTSAGTFRLGQHIGFDLSSKLLSNVYSFRKGQWHPHCINNWK